MTDPQALKELLTDGCVMVYQNGEHITTLYEHGIKNILKLADSGCQGGAVADIIVGKAAAMVMAYMKIESVWASLISRPALEVFEQFQISCQYDKAVDLIKNRRGDGLCPMEQRVIDISNPKEAYEILKSVISQ